MKPKPVHFRELARQDIDDILAHYLAEASPELALRFTDALEQACTIIARHPGAGSTRHAHELDLPGLRHRTLQHFPHLVFYVEHDDHIDVWRVLHGSRDIPDSLREDAGPPP
jgi:toxin ParE1/3/4